MQMGGTGAVFYEDDLRPARRPGFLRSSRPDRLTEADLARQRLAMERWDKRQRSAVRRDRLASLAVWALVMAGTVVMLLATGRLGWMAGP